MRGFFRLNSSPRAFIAKLSRCVSSLVIGASIDIHSGTAKYASLLCIQNAFPMGNKIVAFSQRFLYKVTEKNKIFPLITLSIFMYAPISYDFLMS